MSMLWRASVRHLLRHPAQLALALTGLALGVATIVAVDIATGSSRRAFELSMEAVNGAATHRLSGGPAGLDERFYAELQSQRSNIDLAPIIEGYVTVGGRAMQLIGIDPLADPLLREPRRNARRLGGDAQARQWRRWFIEHGAVMMAARTADELRIAAGDHFEIRIGGRPHTARLLERIADERPGYDAIIVTDIAQAQEWFGLLGRLSRVDVRVPQGQEGEMALRRLRQSLPAGMELQETQRSARHSLDMTAAFTANLQAMSLLALFVSAFLIYSAISFAVVQRRPTIGVLRALGATRSAVLQIVLAEAAVIGIVGSGLGLAAGVALGRRLIQLVSRTINDLYFVVAVNEAVLPASSIVKAMLCGVGVALLAAALPATEAANSAPQLGIRRSVLERRAVNLSRWLVSASAVLAGAAVIVVSCSGRSLFGGFVALFLVLLSVAALTPAALRVLARLAAHIAGRWSPVARLAFGDVAAALSRTGVAVAALGLAVSAMLGVSVMVESFRGSLREWLVRTVSADIYVSAPGPGFGRPERRLDPALVGDLLDVHGIRAHTESRRVLVDSPNGPVPLDAVTLTSASRAAFELTAGDAAQAWPRWERGAILVSEPLAWRLQLGVGDALTLSTTTGPRAFEVAGIYREYGSDRGSLLISRAVYRRLWRDPAITSLGLYLTSEIASAPVIHALRSAAQGRQALYIRSSAEVRELSMRIFERTFVITRVLYWLAAAVAAIGLISALLAWELERARELAIVRSLGLTPRRTAALVALQTGFMGFAALLAAIPAGLLTGVLLIEVINRRAFGWQIDLHLTSAQFTNALLLALSAALAAALYPAWRSSRAPIAAGIREE